MNRIAIIGVIIENASQTPTINQILHDYSEFIIGRMGLPHRERNLNIISIVLDAPNNTINALSGKLGKLGGISTKTIYSKEFDNEN